MNWYYQTEDLKIHKENKAFDYKKVFVSENTFREYMNGKILLGCKTGINAGNFMEIIPGENRIRIMVNKSEGSVKFKDFESLVVEIEKKIILINKRQKFEFPFWLLNILFILLLFVSLLTNIYIISILAIIGVCFSDIIESIIKKEARFDRINVRKISYYEDKDKYLLILGIKIFSAIAISFFLIKSLF